MGTFSNGVYKYGQDPGADSMTANYVVGVFQSIIFIIGIFFSGVYMYYKRNKNAFPQLLFKGIIISNLLTSVTLLPHSTADLFNPQMSYDMFPIKVPLINGTHVYELNFARNATLADLIEQSTYLITFATSWSFCFMLMVMRCIKIRYPFYDIKKKLVALGIVFIAMLTVIPGMLLFSYTYQPYGTFYTSYIFTRFSRILIGVQIADVHHEDVGSPLYNLTYDQRMWTLFMNSNSGINIRLKLVTSIIMTIPYVIYFAVGKHILSLLKNLRNDQNLNREILKKSTKTILIICTTNLVTNLVVILSAIITFVILRVLMYKNFNKNFLNWTFCYGPYFATAIIMTSVSLVQPALMIVTDPEVKQLMILNLHKAISSIQNKFD